MKKINGAVSTAIETTPKIAQLSRGSDLAENVSQIDAFVKQDRSRAEQLQWLLSHCCSSGDLVEEVKKIYPKFDKPCMSKAKRSDQYGLEIRDDVLKHLWQTYAPEEYARRKRQSDGHKLTKRLYCRLPDEVYEQFIQKVREDGYADCNACLTALITDYLQTKGKGEEN